MQFFAMLFLKAITVISILIMLNILTQPTHADCVPFDKYTDPGKAVDVPGTPAANGNVTEENSQKSFHLTSPYKTESYAGYVYSDGSALFAVKAPRGTSKTYFYRIISDPYGSAIQHVYRVPGNGNCTLSNNALLYDRVKTVNIFAGYY
jgi:hypothetical protein